MIPEEVKANVSIVLTDANKRILWVNDVFTKLTGYELSEVAFKKPSMLQGVETDPQAIAEMSYCLENGFPFKNELINYKKNGQKYICRLVVHPIRGADGVISNYIAFEVDAGTSPDDSKEEAMHFNMKYQTSSLKGVKSLELYHRLKRMMKAEKPFLNGNLNLPTLAERLDTNTKYLSQVVNNHFGSNLQQFINEYRTAEAKRRLLDEEFQNLTYFGIGQLCGFRNKSTFYKVFKKATNLTPHEFVLQNRSEQLVA
ncbi:MAG: PAS domain-containing protein [Saprospiraceae bacterium]